MGSEDWRHADLAAELVERREDLWQAHTGSRVVLVRVPPGWGRSSTVLDRFAAQTRWMQAMQAMQARCPM